MLTYINLNWRSLSIGHDHDVEESAAQNFNFKTIKFSLRNFTRLMLSISTLFVDVQKRVFGASCWDQIRSSSSNLKIDKCVTFQNTRKLDQFQKLYL